MSADVGAQYSKMYYGGGGGGDTPTSAVTAETVHLDPIYKGSGGVTVAMHSSTPKCNCAGQSFDWRSQLCELHV